jgi:nucleoside-diphosphate-sugar epimerase
MKIMITGGSGFVGKYVSHQLHIDGHDVASLDIVRNGGPNDFLADATIFPDLKQALEFFRPDIVIHLAALAGSNGKGGGAESMKQPYEFIDTNVNATLNLYEACRQLGISNVLCMSSFSPYGQAPCPINEETPFHPNNPYGASKACVEEIAKCYSVAYGIKTVLFRPPLICGEGQREMNALREFVSCVLNDKPIVILGEGRHVREFVHPEDVARAFSLGIGYLHRMKSPYDVFVLGNEPISMAELASLVVKQIGRGSIEFKKGTSQVFDQYTDHRKISTMLGWSPRIGVEEIVNRVISDMSLERSISSLPQAIGVTPSWRSTFA